VWLTGSATPPIRAGATPRRPGAHGACHNWTGSTSSAAPADGIWELATNHPLSTGTGVPLSIPPPKAADGGSERSGRLRLAGQPDWVVGYLTARPVWQPEGHHPAPFNGLTGTIQDAGRLGGGWRVASWWPRMVLSYVNAVIAVPSGRVPTMLTR